MSPPKSRRMAEPDVLRIAAAVDQLAAVRQFVRQIGEREGAEPEAVADIVQAVDEAVTNVIVHGYSGRRGTVEIEVERDRQSLVVRLRDAAPPFDPTLLPAPDLKLPLERRPPGGMGVFLTRVLMDQVTYRRTDGTNELTLVKRSIEQED